jgi:hypothetical protein
MQRTVPWSGTEHEAYERLISLLDREGARYQTTRSSTPAGSIALDAEDHVRLADPRIHPIAQSWVMSR